jgi:hypothetical protein
MMRPHIHDVEASYRLAQAPPDAVALGSGSVLPGNREADPDRTQIVAPAALQGECGCVHARATGNGEKVRPLR